MSIETLQEIVLNMYGAESHAVCIHAQQGDTSSRKVRIHLLGFNNEKYTVPSDSVAVLYVEKLDGHEVFDKCEVEEEGSLIVTLAGQTVACSGRQKAQIYIVSADGAKDIKSQVFYINVERAAYSEDAIESSDDYGVLRELVQSNKQIESVVGEAVQNANDATEKAIEATEAVTEAAKHHASAIVNTAFGESVVVTDSADGEVQGLKLFGKTEQFTTTGKNLWNKDSGNLLGMFISGEHGNALITTANATMIYIPCEPNTTYTISKIAGTRFQTAYTTEFPNELINAYGIVYGNTANSHTITTGNDAAYLVSYVHHATHDSNITLEEMLASIQIEKGAVATSYEPYTGGIPSPNPQYPQELVSVGDSGDITINVDNQILSISTPNGLPGIQVTDESLATYTDESGQMWCSDEVDFERGVYVKRLYKGIAPKSGWSLNAVNDSYSEFLVNATLPSFVTASVNTTSTHFMAKDNNRLRYASAYGFFYARIPIELGFDTAEKANAMFAEGITFMAILATPVETPLTDEELAQYASLRTNYPVTTVLNDSGAYMELEYNVDTKKYIDNKFAEMQNAILSMGGNV